MRSATSPGGSCGHGPRPEPGGARDRPPAHHRRRPAGHARAGAPRRVDRRQGQERLGGRARSVHRRDLRHGDVPLVRRERLPRDRRHRTTPVHRPDRLGRLRAGLRVQDDDRGSTLPGTVTPGTRIKDVGTLRLDKGRTKVDNANRQGMGWLTFEDAIAWSRNVVAAKVALRLGRNTKKAATTPRRGCGSASGSRPGSTSRARSPARPTSATPRSPRGARSTSPTAPSARAWR